MVWCFLFKFWLEMVPTFNTFKSTMPINPILYSYMATWLLHGKTESITVQYWSGSRHCKHTITITDIIRKRNSPLENLILYNNARRIDKWCANILNYIRPIHYVYSEPLTTSITVKLCCTFNVNDWFVVMLKTDLILC